MKYRVKLLQPTRTENKFGEETVTWTVTGVVYAERAKQTGRRSDEVGEHFSEYSVQYNIRDAHTVADGWRVQQLGGYLYTVTNIIPNLDRGYKTLVCERVNE